MRDLNLRRQNAAYGIHFADSAILAMDETATAAAMALDSKAPIVRPAWYDDYELALDAQAGLVTTANSGIPGFLTNIIDPQLITVLTQPLSAVKIMGGEQKKGTWTDRSTQFHSIQYVGEVSSYGDYNNNGTTDVNDDWTPRQSYNFQTISTWGDYELDVWGKLRISASAEKRNARAYIMNVFSNQSYFYGIANLQNYGLLNDPSLPASITPTTKAAGGTTWAVATQQEIYNDFLKLFNQLLAQTGFNIDMNTPLTLALSNTLNTSLAKINAFGQTALQPIRAAFPNLTIEVAPQYSTTAGELIQLIAPNINGMQTAYPAYTEKMRTHGVVRELSAFKEKNSGGTWGSIIRRPLAIASMLGA